ncbi:hypothetical protein HDU84_001612 [Entophlyctis sp. JEL0112]|nr:hypothetical protein HDU84_001612 [Entophlyctis sp. JEL0112]
MSQRDLSEFVSYLLDGSGAENALDLARLRRELEEESATATTNASHSNSASVMSMSMNMSNVSRRSLQSLSPAHPLPLQPPAPAAAKTHLHSISRSASPSVLSVPPRTELPSTDDSSGIRKSEGSQQQNVEGETSAVQRLFVKAKSQSSIFSGNSSIKDRRLRKPPSVIRNDPIEADDEDDKFHSNLITGTSTPLLRQSAKKSVDFPRTNNPDEAAANTALSNQSNKSRGPFLESSVTTPSNVLSSFISNSNNSAWASKKPDDRSSQDFETLKTQPHSTSNGQGQAAPSTATSDPAAAQQQKANMPTQTFSISSSVPTEIAPFRQSTVSAPAVAGQSNNEGARYAPQEKFSTDRMPAEERDIDRRENIGFTNENSGRIVGVDDHDYGDYHGHLDVDESLAKIYGGYRTHTARSDPRAFVQASGSGLESENRTQGLGSDRAHILDDAFMTRGIGSRDFSNNIQPSQPSVADDGGAGEALSRRLTSLGYPPLAGDRQGNTYRLIETLLDELAKRKQDAQQMTDAISAGNEVRRQLEERVRAYESDRQSGENKDWRIIREQQESLASTASQLAVLRNDLVTVRHDLEDEHALNSRLKRKIAELEVERICTKDELESFKRKLELSRKQSEKSFAQIAESINRYHSDPTKSGVDRLTLEVISVYEEKLQKLHEEVAELKKGSIQNPPDGFSVSTGENANTGGIRTVDLDKELEALEKSGEANSAYGRKTAMEARINSLEDQLAQSQRELLVATQQAELLKLQLLETKKPSWVEQARNDMSAGLTTREMIRRDKKSWKMKLYQVDALSFDECRELLKQVCIRLAISDIPSLLPGLSAIDKTLRLLPQIQSFVASIDSLVQRQYTHLFEGSTGGIASTEPSDKAAGADDAVTGGRAAKLTELVEIVSMWSRAAQEVDTLREFRREMYRRLDVREAAGVGACFEALARLKEQLAAARAAAAAAQSLPTPTPTPDDGEGLRSFARRAHQIAGVAMRAGSLETVLSALSHAMRRGASDSDEPDLTRIQKERLSQLEGFADQVCEVLAPDDDASLAGCLEVLKTWKWTLQDRAAAPPVPSEDIQRMSAFISSVHKLLRVYEKAGSQDDCLQVLTQMVDKQHGAAEQSESIFQHIVDHFMEIFEISSVGEVLPAIDDLYVSWAERNAGIARLRGSLRSNQGAKEALNTPGQVLIKAAELIDSFGMNKSGQSDRHTNPVGNFDELLNAVETATKQPDNVSVDWGADDNGFIDFGDDHTQTRSWKEISASISQLTGSVPRRVPGVM